MKFSKSMGTVDSDAIVESIFWRGTALLQIARMVGQVGFDPVPHWADWTAFQTAVVAVTLGSHLSCAT